MIIVHHLDHSRSQRVLWLLEELGLEYELKLYRRHPQTMLAPPELRQVHPLGKSPVIEDNGLVVAESAAILEYLVERYGNGRFTPPAGTPEALRCRYWLHYAEGSAMSPLLLKLVFDQIETKAPFIVRPVAKAIARTFKKGFVLPQIRQHMDFIEAELGKSEWFAGTELTLADMQMSFPLEAAAERAAATEGRPAIAAWLGRIHARPAYQRAVARGNG
jgi:glutathione S-transferase